MSSKQHSSKQHAPLSPDPSRSGRLDAVLGLAVVVVVASVVAGLAWSRPMRSAASVSYLQSGELSYRASTSPSSLYGRAGLTTGQPVYANIVRDLPITYSYDLRFSSRADLEGSEQLVATVGNGQGITRTIPLQAAPKRFSGKHFVVASTLFLAKLQAATDAFTESGSGQVAETYPVSILPSIRLSGSLVGQQFRTSFDDPVTFTYRPSWAGSPGILTPSTATGAPVAGALGLNPSAAATPAGALPPFSATSRGVLRVPAGQAAVLVFGLTVARLRQVSLAAVFAALLLISIVGGRLVRDLRSSDERVRIATRHGSSLVEVDDLPRSGSTFEIEVSTFSGLLAVARRVECPVLHLGEPDDVYAVADNGTLYRYSIASRLESEHAPVRGQRPPAIRTVDLGRQVMPSRL